MGELQNGYTLYPDSVAVGEMPNLVANVSTWSRPNNGTSAIPFGRVISYDAADGRVGLGGTNVAGISTAQKLIPGATANEYPVKSSVGFAQYAQIMVMLATGSADSEWGGDVYYSTITGEIRANAATNFVVLDNAFFVGVASAGNKVEIRFTK